MTSSQPRFRKGDKVAVIGTVKFEVTAEDTKDLYPSVYIDFRDWVGGTKTAILALSAVELITRHWKMGDRVVDSDGTPGVVLAAVEGHAWVQSDIEPENGPMTYRSNELRPEADTKTEMEPETETIAKDVTPVAPPSRLELSPDDSDNIIPAGFDGDAEVQF